MPGDSIFSDEEEAPPAPPPEPPSAAAAWDSPTPHAPSPVVASAAAPSPDKRASDPPGGNEVPQRDAAADEERRQRLRQVHMAAPLLKKVPVSMSCGGTCASVLSLGMVTQECLSKSLAQYFFLLPCNPDQRTYEQTCKALVDADHGGV